MITLLRCLVLGHQARRLNGSFYVVCSRCGETLNLTVSIDKARGR